METTTTTTTNRFDAIAEKVYDRSFWTLVFIILCIIVANVTGFLIKDTEVNIVPKEVLDFIEKTFWVFTIPVSLRIIGKDILPEITKMIVALKPTVQDSKDESRLVPTPEDKK